MAVASVHGERTRRSDARPAPAAQGGLRWLAVPLSLLLALSWVLFMEGARADDELSLVSTTPADCELAVDPGISAFEARFSESVSGATLTITREGGDVPGGGPIKPGTGEAELTFSLTGVTLATATAYTATIDESDAPFTTSFSTAGDTDDLYLTGTTPANCAVLDSDATLDEVTAQFSDTVEEVEVVLTGGGLDESRTATPSAPTATFDFGGLELPEDTEFTLSYEILVPENAVLVGPTKTTFSTAAPDTADGPAITLDPADGAEDVPIDTLLTANFGEFALDDGEDANTITLTTDGDDPDAVDGAVTTTDNGDTVVTFTPDDDLAPGTTYTATLTYTPDGETETVDFDGDWTFTTAADGPAITLDPADGAEDVDIDTDLTANFGGFALDDGDDANTITLKTDGDDPEEVDGAVTTTDNGDTIVTFTPDDDLAPGTTYTATLTYTPDGDTETVTFDGDWTFTTEAADELELIESVPEDGADDVVAEDLRMLIGVFNARVVVSDVLFFPADEPDEGIEGDISLNQLKGETVRLILDEEAEIEPGTEYEVVYLVSPAGDDAGDDADEDADDATEENDSDDTAEQSDADDGADPQRFEVSFTTAKAEQKLAFDPDDLDEVLLSAEEVELDITATSGGEVEVTSDDDEVCEVASTTSDDGTTTATIELTGAGTCALTASQEGDERWLAVEEDRSFTVLSEAVIDPFIVVTPRTFAPGDAFQVDGSGWDPDDTVLLELRSEVIELARVPVEDDGTFSVRLTAPMATPGDHRVVATSLLSGESIRAEALVTILSAFSPSPSPDTGQTTDPAPETTTAADTEDLPRTGMESAVLTVLGLLLVLAGGMLVIAFRSRRQETVSSGLPIFTQHGPRD